MTQMIVNGQPVRIDLDEQTPLLWGLREAMNLTGSKYGCGVGDCGACMVLIDGEALRSCMVTLAEAEGREIVTIEGLSPTRGHPVQQAMVAEQAIQCGFCTPGIVMAAAALLERNPDPSDAQIAEAIPNLCRCGVYPRLLTAVRRAARVVQRRETIAAVPAPAIAPEDAARDVPALRVEGAAASSDDEP